MSPAERLASTNPSARGEVVPVHECRMAAGLTMRQVSEHAKLTLTTLRRVEAGALPRLDVARRLAWFYGTTTETLWPPEPLDGAG